MDEVWKTQMEKRLKFIEDRVTAVEKKQRAVPLFNSTTGGQPLPMSHVDPASDVDLDGAHGNPEIRKDPPRWTGQSFIARRYSDCTPEYLDELASFFEWQMRKDTEEGRVTGGGKPTAFYKRRDAARARGWAARIRRSQQAGPAPKPLSEEDQALVDVFNSEDDDDDDIPF